MLAITIATVQSTSRSLSQDQPKFRSFPVWTGVGFDAARGQAKLISMPPPHTFFKMKTAYEITVCWSSDVCSSDLHHENEIAQSEGAFGSFARHWMHSGMV